MSTVSRDTDEATWVCRSSRDLRFRQRRRYGFWQRSNIAKKWRGNWGKKRTLICKKRVCGKPKFIRLTYIISHSHRDLGNSLVYRSGLGMVYIPFTLTPLILVDTSSMFQITPVLEWPVRCTQMPWYFYADDTKAHQVQNSKFPCTLRKLTKFVRHTCVCQGCWLEFTAYFTLI